MGRKQQPCIQDWRRTAETHIVHVYTRITSMTQVEVQQQVLGRDRSIINYSCKPVIGFTTRTSSVVTPASRNVALLTFLRHMDIIIRRCIIIRNTILFSEYARLLTCSTYFRICRIFQFHERADMTLCSALVFWASLFSS